MRPNRDSIFILVLVLAMAASTSVAVIAATGGSSRVTLQVKSAGGGNFTDTTDVNGTPLAGSSGGSSGGGSGGSSGGSGGSGGGASGGGNQTQGVSGDTIKVGGIFSEGGAIDATVEEDVVRAYFDYVNDHGGVNGHKLAYVSYNDSLDANTACQEASRLYQSDQVFAIVGWLAPFGEACAAPYFESNHVPIVGGLGVPQEFNNPYSFPVTPIFNTDGCALGDYATASGGPLKFHHPGVILVQTAGIQDVANGIKSCAQKNGVTIKDSDIQYVSFTQASYDSIIITYHSEGVDGLITQLDPYSYVRLFQSEQRNGSFPQLAGAGIDQQSVDLNSGITSQLVGTYSFMPVLEAQGNPAGNAEVSFYNNTLARYYPGQVKNQDAFAEDSWIAARLFVEALKRMGNTITRDGLIQALAGGSYDFGGMAPTLNYPASGSVHDANHYASFIQFTSNHTWAIRENFTPYPG